MGKLNDSKKFDICILSERGLRWFDSITHLSVLNYDEKLIPKYGSKMMVTRRLKEAGKMMLPVERINSKWAGGPKKVETLEGQF